MAEVAVGRGGIEQAAVGELDTVAGDVGGGVDDAAVGVVDSGRDVVVEALAEVPRLASEAGGGAQQLAQFGRGRVQKGHEYSFGAAQPAVARGGHPVTPQ